MKRIVWMMLGLTVWVSVHAASFDCAKAGTKVERLICGNPKLSDLDSKLAQDYKGVLGKANGEQKQQLVADQKHWLKFTRNACDAETCLKHAYWSRQAALETFFESRSPLYKNESDKAEAIKQVLATAPLYPLSKAPFCGQIFADLKQMKDVRFVDPVVQTQSYEDPALDPWKKQCQSAPPFNFSFQCSRNIEPADANDVVDGCNVSYGLPPFKLYELPTAGTSREKRYIFYSDDAYGPMNRDFRKPVLGGGFVGFTQININSCLSIAGNYWEGGGKKPTTWNGAIADAGQGDRNGKNYNSIVEYNHQYYFLILHQVRSNYWLDIESVAPYRTKEKQVCNWTPVKR